MQFETLSILESDKSIIFALRISSHSFAFPTIDSSLSDMNQLKQSKINKTDSENSFPENLIMFFKAVNIQIFDYESFS